MKNQNEKINTQKTKNEKKKTTREKKENEKNKNVIFSKTTTLDSKGLQD